jgi:folate-binding protein YgfZ
MSAMLLREFHQTRGGRFTAVNGVEVVADYGEVLAEHAALTENVAVLDLSFRSRVCLTGSDRVKFLHGQVTNDINKLPVGGGCYAALVTAKARMQSDLNVYRLTEELLLDFEPGLTQTISERLQKYVISEDVEVMDVSGLYGLLSVQGPKAMAAVQSSLPEFCALPSTAFSFISTTVPEGEIYLMNRARFGSAGYDFFVPTPLLSAFVERLAEAARNAGGGLCGWEAAEIARIEAGIPRFGADMDETNIPLEAGLENSAISFNKGCYIGQEVISRIKTYSEVAKSLRGLQLADELKVLPVKGEKLYKDGKEAGYITSATRSPRLKRNIALGYVRKETNRAGAELALRTAEGETLATVVETWRL